MWQKAKVGVEIAEKSFNRVSNLYQEGVVSEQKYDEVKAQRDAAIATEKAAKSQYNLALAGAQQEDKEMAAAKVLQAQGVVAEVNSYFHETVLTAYSDGEVAEIFPHVGELVGTGAPIMNIAQMDQQWVSFNVREDCLKDFSIGTEFDGYVPAIDRTIRMKVSYMKDLGDYAAWKATKETGQYDLKTFEVRATPLSISRDLRPGMSVVVKREHRR
jgi:HlyD family secretion protein